MSVSSTFFNAAQDYADARLSKTRMETFMPSPYWQFHPLNWNCKEKDPNENNDDFPNKCFKKANVAKEFFEKLLKPLESHYGKCKQAMPALGYSWICPSNYDSDDVLFLSVDPDKGMGFQSKSKNLSGQCWASPESYLTHPADPKDRDYRSFKCEAWNSLERSDHLLKFALQVRENYESSHVEEYDNQDKKIGTFPRFSFMGLKKDMPIIFFDEEIQFAYLVRQSENLQKWQAEERDKENGLFQAFVAATESAPSKPTAPSNPSYPANACPEPAPANCPTIEPVVCPTPEPTPCPPCSAANTNSGSTQSNGFGFGLISGVIVTVSAVSALVLLRKKNNKTKPPEQPASIAHSRNRLSQSPSRRTGSIKDGSAP